MTNAHCIARWMWLTLLTVSLAGCAVAVPEGPAARDDAGDGAASDGATSDAETFPCGATHCIVGAQVCIERQGCVRGQCASDGGGGVPGAGCGTSTTGAPSDGHCVDVPVDCRGSGACNCVFNRVEHPGGSENLVCTPAAGAPADTAWGCY